MRYTIENLEDAAAGIHYIEGGAEYDLAADMACRRAEGLSIADAVVAAYADALIWDPSSPRRIGQHIAARLLSIGGQR